MDANEELKEELNELVAASVYVRTDDKELYKEAQLVHFGTDEHHIAINGVTQVVPADRVLAASTLGPGGVADMVNLDNLNEASILFNLRRRFALNHIYTYTGAILISVNPYKNLGIYSPVLIREYCGQRLGQLPPHIYAIGDTAYRTMMTNQQDQSILISGESGAGKTEASKKILDFIATVSAREKTDKTKFAPHERILATQPILEAFGNAKTTRNDNSSRFGKLLDIQFDSEGYLIGASIQNYLLEQSRVVLQGSGERSYHIFYFMLEGADKTERDQWAITHSKDYNYTKNGSPDVPGLNSKYEYMQVKRAMTVAGLSAHEQHMSFTLMAGILFIGNIEFTGDEEAKVANIDPLNWACELLQINARQLEAAMTTRVNHIGGEKFVVRLTPSQAADARDTLSKQLYSRNFDWLVSVLNSKTDESASCALRVRLLDIFGFEVFEHNSFEQMCINYTNERLQFQFNEHIFRLEQEAYIEEQIDASDFNYVDNQAAIDLFEKRPVGLILLLDEESRFPRGSDASFLRKICDHHKRHKDFKEHRMANSTVFTVKHFAGDVHYDTTGFLEKNRQRFDPEFIRIMKRSHVQQYANLFEKESSDEKKSASLKQKATVGFIFREELQNLMKVLNATTPHYVRCVKPNTFKSPVEIDNGLVIAQLRCSGVLETIRIRQGGYPNRRPIGDFAQRYRPLVPWATGTNDREWVISVMNELQIHQSLFQIGKTKVFVRDSAYHYLEGLRNEHFHTVAVKIQKVYRGYRARKRFYKLKRAAAFLTFWMRRYLKDSDCEADVKEALELIKPDTPPEQLVENITAIEKLSIREKNVETIVKAGGIDALLNVLKAVHSKNKDVTQACVRSLGRMAISKEYAIMISREGGIREIVSTISTSDDFDDCSADAVQLLDHLSLVDKNVEVVVKEGGVQALQKVLKSVDKDKEINEKIALAAQAMSTLTKNARAARLIGRDDDAVINVLKSINEKPKFSSLCGFGINYLANLAGNRHNWETIVKSGGVDTVARSMALHMGNHKIITESSRVICELAKDPGYADECGKQGTIPLALEFLKDNPEANGVPSLKIIESLCDGHPANIKRLVEAGGIETLLEILKSDPKNPEVLDRLARVLNMLTQSDPALAAKIASSGGAKVFMEALRKHPKLSILCKNSIHALSSLADVDTATFEFIQSEGAVLLITAAMEMHPDDDDLLEIGALALGKFATLKDLMHAMHTIARSRMEEQGISTMANTAKAIGVIGNLALIQENIDKIVEEGGIPILLAVVNGASAEVDSKEACQNIIESGIRAIGRLVKVEKHAAEFLREGGMETLIALLRGHPQLDRLMNACVTAASELITTECGFSAALESELCESIVGVVQHSPKNDIFCKKAQRMFFEMTAKDGAIAKLVDAETIAMSALIINTHNIENPDLSLQSVDYLQQLQDLHPELSEQIVGECGESLLSALLENAEDPEFCLAVMKLLSALCKEDDQIRMFLKDLGMSDVLKTITEANPLDKALVTEATSLLSLVANRGDLGAALRQMVYHAQMLQEDPQDVKAMETLGASVSLIVSMAGDEKNRSYIVENRGLEAMATTFAALSAAPASLTQEKIMEELALGVNRLLGGKDPEIPEIIVQGDLLEALLKGFIDHPSYEKLGEHELAILSEVTKDPELFPHLFSIQGIEALCVMVEAHPLNDEMIASAVRLIGIMANTPELGVEAVKRGGGAALMSAIRHLVGFDKPLTSALLGTGRLADMNEGAGFALEGTGIHDLVSVLATHTASPEVEAAAVNCIAALCNDPKFAEAFAKSEGLKHVLEGLDRYKDNVDYCLSATAIVETCAEHQHAVARIVELKGVDALYQCVLKHPHVEGIQAAAIGGMALCAEADTQTCRVYGQNDSLAPILDSLRRFENSPKVAAAVAHYISSLAHLDSNREALITKGAPDILQYLLNVFPDNEMVRAVVQSAIECLEARPDMLISSIRGLMNNQDYRGLATTLDDFAKMIETTAEVDCNIAEAVDLMADLLRQACKNPAIATSVFRAILSLAANDATGEFAKDFCLKGSLVDCGKVLGTFPDHAPMMPNAIESYEIFSLDANCIVPLKDAKSLSSILDVMTNHRNDFDVQLHGVLALHALASADPDLLKAMGPEGAIASAVEAIKVFPGEPDLIQAVLEFLHACGVDPENLPKLRQAIPTIEWAAKAHEANPGIQGRTAELVSACHVEEVIEEEIIEEIEEEEAIPPPPPEAPAAAISEADKLNKLNPSEGLKAAVSRLRDLRGDRDKLFEAVEHIGARAIGDDTLPDLLDMEAPQRLVMALNKFRDDSDFVSNIARALNRIAVDDDTITEIVANGGIAALLKALKKHMDQPMTLASGVALVGNLATNDHLKTLIGLQGGIRIILRAMELWSDQIILLDKCCYALANLAFNNPPNIAGIINGGGVKIVIDSMDRHIQDVNLMASATTLLSNLCHNSFENKSLLCRSGGARVITTLLRTHSDEDDLVIAAFRALGNLALHKENISLILQEGAVHAIVRTMVDNAQNSDLLQIAITVIQNLASVIDKENLDMIIEAKAVEATIRASNNHKATVGVQMAALGCLANLAVNLPNATFICEAGGIDMTLTTLRILDWEEHVVAAGLSLLAGLAAEEKNTRAIIDENGPTEVLRVMKAHEERRNVIQLALTALGQFIIDVGSAEAVAAQGATDVAIDALKTSLHDNKLMIDAIRLLINLSLVRETAEIIASNAVVPTLNGMHVHASDVVFLRVAASFMGNLAIFPKSAKLIIEQGVAQVFLASCRKLMDFPSVLSKLVRTLVNTLMAATEEARAAIRHEKGLVLVREILARHPNHAELKKACDSFIKKMTEVPHSKRQVATDEILTLREQIPPKWRNRMVAGSVMRKFCKRSAPRKRHLRVSEDFEALIWRDPDNKKPDHMVPIQAIAEIRKGACLMQHKRTYYMHKTAAPERSFAIIAMDAAKKPFSLPLECKTEAEMENWVEMLEHLRVLHEPQGFSAM